MKLLWAYPVLFMITESPTGGDPRVLQPFGKPKIGYDEADALIAGLDEDRACQPLRAIWRPNSVRRNSGRAVQRRRRWSADRRWTIRTYVRWAGFRRTERRWGRGGQRHSMGAFAAAFDKFKGICAWITVRRRKGERPWQTDRRRRGPSLARMTLDIRSSRSPRTSPALPSVPDISIDCLARRPSTLAPPAPPRSRPHSPPARLP